MNKDFISQLASDLKPFRSIDTLKSLSLRFLGVTFFVLLLSVGILPLRFDFSSISTQWFFYLENFIWFILILSAFHALYQSALPDGKPVKAYLFWILGAGLIALSFMHKPGLGLHLELELIRGGCGLIISILTFMSGTYFFIWAKQSAPFSPWKTGLFAALTSSALGSLVMQFVCAWDTSLHLILWHFIPVFILILAGQLLARKLLHW